MNPTRSLFRPLLALVLCFATFLAPHPATVTAAELSEGDFKQWGLLAVQDNGRRKPLDTFARESLLKLSGRSSWTDPSGRKWSANEFLLSVLLGEGHDWGKEPMILLNYHPLAAKLGLDPEKRRFSFEELAKLPELNRMAGEVHEMMRSGQKDEVDRTQQEVRSVSERMTLFANLNRGAAFLIVPPSANAKVKDAWITPPDAAQAFGEARFAPARDRLQQMVSAYLANDAFNFNLHARGLREGLRALCPAVYPGDDALGNEYFYNRLGAFPKAAGFYALGLVLLAAGALPSRFGRGLRIAGVCAGLAGFGLHSVGIALRCIVAGRPPVTNMFESMVWVSFIVMLLGFVFFARYRSLVYLLAALPVASLTMLLVLNAPVAMPGSIDPLVPVLRDNFWLTTHVLTITASYGAFALAIGFAHILLFRYLISPAAANADQLMHFWLYRVLQLGVLLIAVGTILGGVWANYSWGRFWGWDPKETWALITLLCYIVAIHGRIAGWWGQFGLAVGSVVCFAAVVMAWYGVNYVLGKGLHSYGFGVGGGQYVAAVIGADLLFLGVVCWRRWQATSASASGGRRGAKLAPARSLDVGNGAATQPAA